MPRIEISPELLTDLKEKAEKATQEIWTKAHLGNVYVLPTGKETDYQPIVCLAKNYDEYIPTDANAAFIAVANPAVMLR